MLNSRVSECLCRDFVDVSEQIRAQFDGFSTVLGKTAHAPRRSMCRWILSFICMSDSPDRLQVGADIISLVLHVDTEFGCLASL